MGDYSSVLSDFVDTNSRPPIPWNQPKPVKKSIDLSTQAFKRRIGIAKIYESHKRIYYAAIPGFIVSKCKKSGKWTVLKPRFQNNIPRVWIGKKNISVSELMVSAFYTKLIGDGGNYDGRPYKIYHKDGNLRNTKLSNLVILIDLS